MNFEEAVATYKHLTHPVTSTALDLREMVSIQGWKAVFATAFDVNIEEPTPSFAHPLDKFYASLNDEQLRAVRTGLRLQRHNETLQQLLANPHVSPDDLYPLTNIILKNDWLYARCAENYKRHTPIAR